MSGAEVAVGMLPFQLFAARVKSCIPVAVCCELLCKISCKRPVMSSVSSKIAFTGERRGKMAGG